MEIMMSTIPDTAMPKARAAEGESEAASPGLARRAAGLVRDNPKTAIAAGAAVAAGVATAAVVRARRGKAGGGKAGGGKSAGAKRKKG
ncbi:MAG TPA: hypothetical protein VGW40_12210 [Allosphingosinicella sp.]|nr:hypothetical protein [Allosphingosinicella sp.]